MPSTGSSKGALSSNKPLRARPLRNPQPSNGQHLQWRLTNSCHHSNPDAHQGPIEHGQPAMAHQGQQGEGGCGGDGSTLLFVVQLTADQAGQRHHSTGQQALAPGAQPRGVAALRLQPMAAEPGPLVSAGLEVYSDRALPSRWEAEIAAREPSRWIASRAWPRSKTRGPRCPHPNRGGADPALATAAAGVAAIASNRGPVDGLARQLLGQLFSVHTHVVLFNSGMNIRKALCALSCV